MRSLWGAGAAFAALTLFAGAATAQPARLEPVPCTALDAAAEGRALECGFIHVPENRASPDSRTIAVPYMRARSTLASPAPDPLIMLAGGPGARGINAAFTQDHPALATRDVIWFEQRGTELARPALFCPEYVEAGRRAARGETNNQQIARERIDAARACADRARAQGADLRGYNSVEMAADIEDLRRLLRFPAINLYGVSYGGRIALVYARDYPTTARSLVLNTPLPVEADYDAYGSAGKRRTLNMVFDGCAVDAGCAAAFPNAREQYAQILEETRLRPKEVWIEDAAAPGGRVAVRVTDRVLAAALSGQLYAPFQFEVLPRTIGALARGDEDVLRSLLWNGADSQAWLMRIATWCNEEYPFEDQDAIRRQLTDYPEFAGVEESTVPIGACEAAGFSATAPPRENEPVATQTPALILSGAYDPATQPAWHSAMVANMPSAYLATFPAGGHSAGFYYDCAWSMLGAFVADPSKKPDATCMLDLRAPDFGRAARE